jgi:transposase InsO family protein
MSDERIQIRQLVDEARHSGARQLPACEVMGISAKTYQRWCQSSNMQDGRLENNVIPANKLSEWERQRIVEIANEFRFAHSPPCKIVPALADEGVYVASESSFYRVLKAEKQLAHRQKSKSPGSNAKPLALIATAPNQIYSWDITYLPTVIKGLFLYLYLVMDIYSRKIVGWQVYEQESCALAADLMTDICRQEKIARQQVTLHSDNGSPMKGATMLATLQALGVTPSFSRPSVSNDNPYSESLFRTLKYRPEYPEHPFVDLHAARRWVGCFAQWYNTEHLHSAIKFVTPQQRHSGQDVQILANRNWVYQQAKRQHPDRWQGDTRNWSMITEVYLNPVKNRSTQEENKAA